MIVLSPLPTQDLVWSLCLWSTK